MALSSQRIKAILICAMQFSEKGIEFAKVLHLWKWTSFNRSY